MVMTPEELGRMLSAAAARIETLAGGKPCRAFRPHAGWRSGQMYEGLRESDYRLDRFWLDAVGLQLVPRAKRGQFRSAASRRASPTATSS